MLSFEMNCDKDNTELSMHAWSSLGLVVYVKLMMTIFSDTTNNSNFGDETTQDMTHLAAGFNIYLVIK
jgi:hypothetical protein